MFCRAQICLHNGTHFCRFSGAGCIAIKLVFFVQVSMLVFFSWIDCEDLLILSAGSIERSYQLQNYVLAKIGSRFFPTLQILDLS